MASTRSANATLQQQQQQPHRYVPRTLSLRSLTSEVSFRHRLAQQSKNKKVKRENDDGDDEDDDSSTQSPVRRPIRTEILFSESSIRKLAPGMSPLKPRPQQPQQQQPPTDVNSNAASTKAQQPCRTIPCVITLRNDKDIQNENDADANAANNEPVSEDTSDDDSVLDEEETTNAILAQYGLQEVDHEPLDRRSSLHTRASEASHGSRVPCLQLSRSGTRFIFAAPLSSSSSREYPKHQQTRIATHPGSHAKTLNLFHRSDDSTSSSSSSCTSESQEEKNEVRHNDIDSHSIDSHCNIPPGNGTNKIHNAISDKEQESPRSALQEDTLQLESHTVIPSVPWTEKRHHDGDNIHHSSHSMEQPKQQQQHVLERQAEWLALVVQTIHQHRASQRRRLSWVKTGQPPTLRNRNNAIPSSKFIL